MSTVMITTKSEMDNNTNIDDDLNILFDYKIKLV